MRITTIGGLLLLSMGAACSDGGDDGPNGGGDGDGPLDPEVAEELEALEVELDELVLELCGKANGCYQPDIEPGDEDWCRIPTRITEDVMSYVSYQTREQDMLDIDPCYTQLRQEHPEEMKAMLECTIAELEAALPALDSCPEEVTVLDDEGRADCNDEIEVFYNACDEAREED